MDTPFLKAMAALLAERGIATYRFEFAYMAARRQGGWTQAAAQGRAADGGVSGGCCRAATWCACCSSAANRWVDAWQAWWPTSSSRPGASRGLVCLGYPFHPPNKPEQLRTAHLRAAGLSRAVRAGRARSLRRAQRGRGLRPIQPRSSFHWAGDGDHDLGPRGASGFTRKGNLAAAADADRGLRARRLSGATRLTPRNGSGLRQPLRQHEHGGQDHGSRGGQHAEQRVETPVLVDEGNERQRRRQHGEADHVAHAVDARPPFARRPGGRSCSR